LAEQKLRREQEGDDFDEQAYDIEEALMKSRSKLEERRILQEEQIYQAYRDLDAQQLPGDAYNTAREALERSERKRRAELETEFHALEQEQQADSAKRQRSDLEAQLIKRELVSFRSNQRKLNGLF
jgi:hypothetical protein